MIFKLGGRKVSEKCPKSVRIHKKIKLKVANTLKIRYIKYIKSNNLKILKHAELV